ncbi:MAG: Zn-ribbon domain-containing OB-fold protein [Pseudomonadales bacterium]
MTATDTGAAKRWRPILNYDNRFFWEGVNEGRLLIQRCSHCETLRHPPGPMCPQCQSLQWDTLQSAGKGEIYSYVVMHHPVIPTFDYPNPVALIALDEGTRLITQLSGIQSENVSIGMRVELAITEVEEGLSLPLFKPVS